MNLMLPSASSVLNVPDLLQTELPPFSNTGGNYSSRSKKTEKSQNEICIIDYLTVSYPAEAFDVPFASSSGEDSLKVSTILSTSEWLENVARHVRTWTNLENIALLDIGRGFLGFKNSANICVMLNDGSHDSIGVLAWGGASQKGRVMLSLTGVGTAMIENWLLLSEWIESTKARISRVDIAVDFVDGGYSVEDALQDFEDGNFRTNNAGSPPNGRLISDLGSNEGKTLYVGKRENGKMVRIYEKGKQLGDKLSKWVRAEVELHNKDRIIPVDVLLNPLSYWSGMNKVFNTLIPIATKQIKTAKKIVEATLSSLSQYASLGYGKLLNALMMVTDNDHEKVVNFLIKDGFPRRLRPSLIAQGFHDVAEVAANGRFLILNPQ